MSDPFKEQATLGGGRFLQFGCGPHPLPSPWETYDQEVDIAEPLPFPSECASFIHAEHVIEHVPFKAGRTFLRECFRVLEPGGVVRILFPDCERFLPALAGFGDQEPHEYLDFLKRIGQPHRNALDVMRYILCESGHQSAWTCAVGVGALHAAGFQRIDLQKYAESSHGQLVGIDRHHLTSPRAVVEAETTVLEGTK
ncbi:MAG TPA: methyltransferase domain-containing protein [Verrucomicrobiae bacterium]|nr:methyltransferase domain-containing protein [Verrucomicrobiae bacterium]